MIEKSITVVEKRDIDLFLDNFLKIRSRSNDDFSLIKKELEDMSAFAEIRSEIISTQDVSAFWNKVKKKYLEYVKTPVFNEPLK